VTENQPARRPAAAAGDWQDIYLRDKDGGTDVRLLLARLLERAGARYEVHGDGQFTRAAGPDGQLLTAQAAAGYARSLNAAGGGTYRAVAVVPLET
jgi:hypothetical protein